MQQQSKMTSNRNSFNRLSLNLAPSSVSPLQQQQQLYNTVQAPPPVYQPPQPSWWNNGLVGLGGGARRNSSMFNLEDMEESQIYNNRMNNINNNNQYNYQDSQQQLALPTIQIDQSQNLSPNGYISSQHNTSGSSPTHSISSPTQPCHRGRANSSITAARNKLRIMAMLDDVRKKRELRDRRKSDIMAYLDDMIVPDDPAMANAAGALKLYRRRFKIYQFLNHPSTGTPWSITYHVMVFVIVFVCLILTICATIQQAPLQEKAIKSVYMLEKVVVVWFNIEFGLGLWSCACKKRYRGLMGKVRYLTIPSRLIDLVILSFTTIVLVFNPSKTGHEVFVVSAFRGFHRFFQVAQVLTLNRPLKPWKVLASVIYDQREQLFIIYYTEFIVLCVLAYVAFLVERDTNENFNSIADAMWWAIVTLSTVGYGDRVPVTWIGKIISTMFTILGVAIFALPAGIIGTGLALKIEEVERNQIRNRKKVAAAILIQRAYRSWKAHTTYELVSKFFRERPMPIYKQHDYLSMAQKFIALVQFYIALNKFRELLRPLDLKTVMQSYSDGQTEVLLRTKLVQQSIEELARRVEMTENRVANMSMRIETKQNTFERRIDHIRQLMESCHRQLLANHLLVELLRTNNQRYHVNSTMTTGRKYPSIRGQLPPLSKQPLLLNQNQQNNKTKTAQTATNTSTLGSGPKTVTSNNSQQQQPLKTLTSISSSEPATSNDQSLSSKSQEQKSSASSVTSVSNNKQPSSMITNLKPIRLSNLDLLKKNLYPITSSGSNINIEDTEDEDVDLSNVVVIGGSNSNNQPQNHPNGQNQQQNIHQGSRLPADAVVASACSSTFVSSNRQNVNIHSHQHHSLHNHHHGPLRPRRMSL